MTFYYLTGDVTFLAAATDGQMIARFVAHSASRKQQTTFKIQIKQENVYYIYESIDLYSILYIINRRNFYHQSLNIFILVYAKNYNQLSNRSFIIC